MKKFSREFYKERGEESIGDGAEKSVYISPDNPDRVVGIFHYKEGPETVKGRYYLTKILHLLYPENIPDLHLAASDPQVVEIDKVDGVKHGSSEEYDFIVPDFVLGIQKKLGVILDEYDKNYYFKPDETAWYVDTVLPWHNRERNYDLGKIIAAIEEELTGENRDLARFCLSRLEALFQEYQEKNKKNAPRT